MTDGAWPLVLDLAKACRFTTRTRSQFRALVAAGLFPPGRRMPDGAELWHRGEIERAVDRLWQIEAEAQGEQRKTDARRALEAFDPAAQRRPAALCRDDEGRRRADLPLLPAGRAKDTPSAA